MQDITKIGVPVFAVIGAMLWLFNYSSMEEKRFTILEQQLTHVVKKQDKMDAYMVNLIDRQNEVYADLSKAIHDLNSKVLVIEAKQEK